MKEVTAVQNPAKTKLGHLKGNKQAGFGALEVMLALGVGLLVVIGAIAWKSKLDNSGNNQAEVENIASLISNIKQLKTASGYGASETDLIPLLISSEGVPGNMAKTASTVNNTWGGSVSLSSTGSGYTLTYAGVPTANCVFLSTQANNGNGMSLRINGGAAITGEVTSAAAGAACSSASNSLAWSGR